MTQDMLILRAACEAWQRLEPLRRNRRRYARFTYGDQWSDPANDLLSRGSTEYDEAVENGCKPLTNNLIRRLVKTVVGRFRQQRAEGRNDRADIDPRGLNRLDELDARTLEEFLISGMAIHRVCRERRRSADGVWVDAISPDRFFVSAFNDPRGSDIELAGCLHDMSMAEVLMRFAGGSAVKAARIRKAYGDSGLATSPLGDLSPRELEGGTMFYRAANGRCRVVEVWTLESGERIRCHDPLTATFGLLPARRWGRLRRINQKRRREGLPQVETRREYSTVWHCRMMAPNGLLLDSFDSPMADGDLPFAVKMYPMVGGEVHPLVEDVIDQQKCVNRLISLMDHIMGVSAKGTLLFPVECLPVEADAADPERSQQQMLEDYAAKWSRTGAVIPYRSCDGVEPHQVSTPAADVGALEMLRTQIQLFEDISGVNSALMGKNVSAAVGVQRYESELRNSAVSILDLMETFADFTSRRDALMGMA